MLSTVVVCALIGLTVAKIPDDVRYCSPSDPKFFDCVNTTAPLIVSYLKEGLPEWDVPKLDPFHIQEILLADDSTIKATARDVDVYQLTEFVINQFTIDEKAGNIAISLTIPSILMDAGLSVNLNLGAPISAQGPIKITTDTIGASVGLSYKKITRKGDVYLYFDSITLKLSIQNYQATFKLAEDPGSPLEQAVNMAISDSKPEILEKITPVIQDSVSKLVIELLNKICKHMKYNQIFPDH